MDKKEDLSVAGYVLGILSIVFGFLSPIAGLVFGIIGFNISKKQGPGLSLRAKKLNKIGIIISIIVLVLSLALAWYFNKAALQGAAPF